MPDALGEWREVGLAECTGANMWGACAWGPEGGGVTQLTSPASRCNISADSL